MCVPGHSISPRCKELLKVCMEDKRRVWRRLLAYERHVQLLLTAYANSEAGNVQHELDALQNLQEGI